MLNMEMFFLYGHGISQEEKCLIQSVGFYCQDFGITSKYSLHSNSLKQEPTGPKETRSPVYLLRHSALSMP